MNRRMPTSLVVLVLFVGATVADEYVRCDAVADGCESGNFISVETLIATANPDGNERVHLYGDSDGFGVSQVGLQQVGDFFNTASLFHFYDFNFTASPLIRNVTLSSLSLTRVHFSDLSGFSSCEVTFGAFLTDCYNIANFTDFADMTNAARFDLKNFPSLTTLEGLSFGEGDLFSVQLLDCPLLASAPFLSTMSNSLDSLTIGGTALLELPLRSDLTIFSVKIFNNPAMTSVPKLSCTPRPLDTDNFWLYNMSALTTFGGVDFNEFYPLDLFFGNLPLVNEFTVANLTMQYGGNFYVFAYVPHVTFENVLFVRPPKVFYVVETGITDFDGVTVALEDGHAAGVVIHNNDALTQFDNLAGLFDENEYQFYFSSYAYYATYFPVLGLEAAEGLRVTDNDVLTSLGGLTGVNSVYGTCYIANNPSLEDTSGLEGLSQVQTQDATYYVNYNSVFGAWIGSFSYLNNGGSSLSLKNLTSVAGAFNVVGNSELVSLDITSLTSVGGYVNVTDNSCDMSCVDLATAATVSASKEWASTVDSCSSEACNSTSLCSVGTCVPSACGGVCVAPTTTSMSTTSSSVSASATTSASESGSGSGSTSSSSMLSTTTTSSSASATSSLSVSNTTAATSTDTTTTTTTPVSGTASESSSSWSGVMSTSTIEEGGGGGGGGGGNDNSASARSASAATLVLAMVFVLA